ncbi:MAG TPA: ATP-dependent sacrificial sulfur transferase LarE [Anaeromyxobacteraceae bacterium]|nr:ATP-dependent sacrificial sulfur transferase LarE [Anaeromyxobacteraceae bacterium]
MNLDSIRASSALKLDRLRALIGETGGTLVAFSGGVDSTFVLAVAREVLGDRAVALTAHSPSVPATEREEARELARAIGARHVEVESREGDDPRYAANPIDRCYYCKTELYRLCADQARRLGLASIVDGFNADDRKDHRPGHQAALEGGIRSPLAEAGLGKLEVRAWSEAYGLPTWDKPQMACLASRLPYGVAVTPERLGQVERAEHGVRLLGFRNFRVRWHDAIGRVEVAEDEVATAFEKRAEIAAAVKAAGFKLAVLDLESFRSGRLNELAGVALPVLS